MKQGTSSVACALVAALFAFVVGSGIAFVAGDASGFARGVIASAPPSAEPPDMRMTLMGEVEAESARAYRDWTLGALAPWTEAARGLDAIESRGRASIVALLACAAALVVMTVWALLVRRPAPVAAQPAAAFQAEKRAPSPDSAFMPPR